MKSLLYPLHPMLKFVLKQAWFASLPAALLAGSGPARAALDLPRVEAEIHRLTNAMRAEKGLPPLAALPDLDTLARTHSQDMAKRHFFAHDNPDGASAGDRLRTRLPGLLTAGSAENIAMRSLGGDEKALAYALMQQWRHSPGHYANIISARMRQLGAGVAVGADGIYATQDFTDALVQLETPLPDRVLYGRTVIVDFRFLAGFAPAQLSAFLHVPDPQTRFPAGGNRFYTGGGPLQPEWRDADHFRLRIPVSYGRGVYSLGIGSQGSYYPTPYRFEAVDALSAVTESESCAGWALIAPVVWECPA